MRILIATHRTVLLVDPATGSVEPAYGLEGRRPSCLAGDPRDGDRVWCGTVEDGVFRSGDGGRRWRRSGLVGERITSIAASPTGRDVVWAGTEPSALWRSADLGASWERRPGMDALPSSGDWSFPPRPDTHHVRWIACHPRQPARLWLAIEAGALIRTPDGGQTWQDRVPGGPWDTHELAIHPDRPNTLRVAAGDGYYESDDGGDTWTAPDDGLDVGYLRSVVIDPGDPDRVVVSAASHAHAAYVAGRSDGRLYGRTGSGRWERITAGWPDPPSTIAPLLAPGPGPGELWAADERGLHRSRDGGATWEVAAELRARPQHLRGLVG